MMFFANILCFSIDFLLKIWYHLGAYTLFKNGQKSALK